jgi:hypothetical protein
MKKAFLLLSICIVVISCKTVPAPENKGDSLVIGSVVWDYPDGFYLKPPRTFKDSFIITFFNVTAGEQIKVKSSSGYFYFLCNGSDKFILQQVTYVEPNPSIDWTISYNLNLQFESRPAKINYLGRITITFASPEYVKTKQGAAVIYTYCRFRDSYAIENKTEDLKKYLAVNDKQKLWENYEIAAMFEN